MVSPFGTLSISGKDPLLINWTYKDFTQMFTTTAEGFTCPGGSLDNVFNLFSM